MRVSQLGFQIFVLASCKDCPRFGKGINDCLDGYDTRFQHSQTKGLCPRRRKAEELVAKLAK